MRMPFGYTDAGKFDPGFDHQEFMDHQQYVTEPSKYAQQQHPERCVFGPTRHYPAVLGSKTK